VPGRPAKRGLKNDQIAVLGLKRDPQKRGLLAGAQGHFANVHGHFANVHGHFANVHGHFAYVHGHFSPRNM
jgi:hypothetical protein